MGAPTTSPVRRDRSSFSLEDIGDQLGRLPLRPAEGWLTVLAVLAMVIAVAASFVEAGWTPAWAGDSGFLLWLGPLGFALGLAGAKVGWGRWRAHLVGALFAGLVIPLVAGGQVLDIRGLHVGWDPAGLAARMSVAWDIFDRVWTDFAVLHLPTTGEAAHYHMIFGAIIWGAGQLAGFTVFGHRRPLDAVVVLGLVLLANMAVTQHDQLPFLVAYTAAALVLLIRTHVFEEQITWARRRIGDPAAVGGLYIKGGSAFVAAAVLGSILLTFTASSAPLQGLWRDLPKQLQGLSQLIQAIAPKGGDPNPIGGVTFGSSVTSTGKWNPSTAVAFRAQLPPGEDAEFKWRAGTFAQFNTFGWSWGTTTATTAPAGGPLLDGQADEPPTSGRRPISFQVFPEAFRDQWILGPNAIASVDRATITRTVGTQGWFATVESSEAVAPYQVTALIPVAEDVPGGLTEARLRTAGFSYPDEIRTLYIQQLPADALGPEATRLLQTIRAAVVVPDGFDANNPYDLARTMESYLRNPNNFSYDADITEQKDQVCSRISMVECFATIKAGYCEYYATTMAVLLREAGVPARIAYGFLHGTRDQTTNVEEVGGSLAHWWVEVYFPGTGWVEFDPTGQVGQPAELPEGSIGPSTQRPSFTFAPRTAGPTSSGGAVPPNGPGSTGIGPFIAIALILIVAMGALALAAVRRAPRNPMHPDQAWGSLARLASRLGLGPRPSQTVYEYAGALGDEVPTARVELTTIARAKVEVAYGRRDLGNDRLKGIALAYHRLRLALLGLVVRRSLRRGGRR